MRKKLVREKRKNPKKILAEGVGWVPGWEMVGDLNFGPHTQVELSGPSRELLIYF